MDSTQSFGKLQGVSEHGGHGGDANQKSGVYDTVDSQIPKEVCAAQARKEFVCVSVGLDCPGIVNIYRLEFRSFS